jgi:hypothetical protein
MRIRLQGVCEAPQLPLAGCPRFARLSARRSRSWLAARAACRAVSTGKRSASHKILIICSSATLLVLICLQIECDSSRHAWTGIQTPGRAIATLPTRQRRARVPVMVGHHASVPPPSPASRPNHLDARAGRARRRRRQLHRNAARRPATYTNNQKLLAIEMKVNGKPKRGTGVPPPLMKFVPPAAVLFASALLTFTACARQPGPKPVASTVIFPAPSATTVPAGLVPYTAAELQAIGKQELIKVEAELAREFTPLRALGNGFYVDGACALPSDAEKAKANAQIQVWNAARVRSARNRVAKTTADRAALAKIAVAPAEITLSCVDGGDLWAKLTWVQEFAHELLPPSQTDMLVRVGSKGVALLHEEFSIGEHQEWTRWRTIDAVILAASANAGTRRDVFIKVSFHEGGAIAHSSSWYAFKNEVRIRPNTPGGVSCNGLDDEAQPVLWHEQIALVCSPKSFDDVRVLYPYPFLPDFAPLLPSGNTVPSTQTPDIMHANLQKLAASHLATLPADALAAGPTATADVRQALGILGYGHAVRRRMGIASTEEVEAADRIWKLNLGRNMPKSSATALPNAAPIDITTANTVRIIALLQPTEATRVRAYIKEAGTPEPSCRLQQLPATLRGKQWQTATGTLVYATWELSAAGNCNLPDEPQIAREGLFRIAAGSAYEIATSADTGYSNADGGPREREMLFEWTLGPGTAVALGDTVWRVSHDTRKRPDARAHDLLRADSADGQSAQLMVPTPSGPRAVGFYPTTGGIYAVDGTNIHVLRNSAWVAAPETDADVVRIRAEWQHDDIAKTLPEPVSGMTYDQAYAELGVPANERATFFAPLATTK